MGHIFVSRSFPRSHEAFLNTNILDLFNRRGKMLTAIRPPESIVPKRNGTDSFSADSPPRYNEDGAGDDVTPADPDTGRDNNHGAAVKRRQYLEACY